MIPPLPSLNFQSLSFDHACSNTKMFRRKNDFMNFFPSLEVQFQKVISNFLCILLHLINITKICCQIQQNVSLIQHHYLKIIIRRSRNNKKKPLIQFRSIWWWGLWKNLFPLIYLTRQVREIKFLQHDKVIFTYHL